MNWEGGAVGGNLVICRDVSQWDKLLSLNLITLVPPLFNEHGSTELLFLTNKNKILSRVLLNSCAALPQFLTCAPSVQWTWMHGTSVPLIKICFLFYLFLVLWSNALNTRPRLPTRPLPGFFPNPDLRLLSSSQHVIWSWRHFDFVCCN